MSKGDGADACLLDRIVWALCQNTSSENNLSNVLSTQEDLQDDGFHKSELDDECPVEVIYEGKYLMNSVIDKSQSVAPIQQKESLENTLSQEEGKVPNKCIFFQTKNENYRTFMEETMLIKYCSKKILQSLEDIKPMLEWYIDIENDPGFGRIHSTQAWTWIVKEAMISTSFAVKNDKNKKKMFQAFSTKLLLEKEKSFMQLMVITKRALKTYDKIWRVLNTLMDKTLVKFWSSVEGSLDYELRASGYNFFFHQKDPVFQDLSESAQSTKEEKVLKYENPHNTSATSPRSLQVRCGVDGVTLHSGKMGNNWLKFKKVDQDKDMQLLLKIFVNSMTENYEQVMENMTLVNEILEFRRKWVSTPKRKGFQDSILQSINKCQEIVTWTPFPFNFLPKEKAIMIYTLKTTKAAYDLIRPLLAEISLSTKRQYAVIQELTKQRKQLLNNGHAENRFPINLNTRFEVLIKDTKVNIDIILNRYPNIRDAKQLKEKLLQKYSSENENEDVPMLESIGEIPIETIHKCPTQQFFSPSTQEIIEMFRKEISEKKNIVNNPNPAHFLFADVEHEYEELHKELATTRIITEEMIALCSDPIQKLHKATLEISSVKDKMLTQVVYSTQKLVYTQSGNSIQKQITPTSSWIQAICKLIHFWDFHSLPKHLQTHFRSVNDESMRWIAKLENSFGELTQMAKDYKEEFFNFHDFVDANHGFTTWVRKVFNFNPPHEIVSKWTAVDLDEDYMYEDNVTLKSENASNKFHLRFQDFDMSLVQCCSAIDEESSTILINLNKSSHYVQVGMVSVLFNYINHIVSSAMVNLNCALVIHQKYINLETLKSTICRDKKLTSIQHIYPLENLVLALTFEMIRKDIKETVDYLGLLNSAISQFNRMFQTIQLHLEDRGIIENVKGTSSFSTKRKREKKEAYAEDVYIDDLYLNETLQLLKSSVGAMPNVYPIQDEHLVNSFLAWVKLANRDNKLMMTIHPPENFGSFENESSECELEKGIPDIPVEESEVDPEWPISFDEAMMLTTIGKAFFPDPVHFSSDIERWRTLCFQMLATALEKFGELTNTKIIRGKFRLINNPNISVSQSDLRKEPCSVGHTQGVFSILCFFTTHLLPSDRRFVSSSDVKLFKEKFAGISDITDKFKKALDVTEKVLVNNLSLSMASVEQKKLPQYLPVLPLENDFLKSHDLDEVGSRVSMPSRREDDESGTHDIFQNLSRDNLEDNFIELQWDSSNKHKVFCKSYGDSESAWLEFCQLNISGQLRLIHIIIDDLMQVFNEALQLIRDAKEDLICAKKLLEKTWEGIGKDMKKGRIPGSGVLVLLKLYRHQVATAVINLKAIRTTMGEVKYLLSQSAQYANKWVSRDDQIMIKSNIHTISLNQSSLSIKLKTTVRGDIWLLKDEEKIAEEISNEEIAVQPVESDGKHIHAIKEAVAVNSSTSILMNQHENYSGGGYEISIKNLPNISKFTRAIRNKADEGKSSITTISSTIQQLILTGLFQSLSILRQPNCAIHSSPGEEIQTPNVIGILAALVSVTRDIRFFKDVMPQRRNSLVKHVSILQEKINQILNMDSGVPHKIINELKKLKKDVQSFDSKVRKKFTDGEFPAIEDIIVSPVQPSCRITPMDFIEDLAASVGGHVWAITTEMPEVGTVLKNNKTLESHALPNIPLSSRMEVLLSVINYLEKIMDHVEYNLECSKNGICSAKSLLKTITKDVGGNNNWFSLGIHWGRENNAGVISKSEIKDYLYSFARISNACTKADETLSQVLDLCQKASEILQQVGLYINLKFKLEPAVGLPTVDNDALQLAQNWQNVDIITGIASPPNVPPPVILKKIAKKSLKQENFQMMYKNAWENKVFALEVHFERFCERHHITVDVPISLIPVFAVEEDDD